MDIPTNKNGEVTVFIIVSIPTDEFLLVHNNKPSNWGTYISFEKAKERLIDLKKSLSHEYHFYLQESNLY